MVCQRLACITPRASSSPLPCRDCPARVPLQLSCVQKLPKSYSVAASSLADSVAETSARVGHWLFFTYRAAAGRPIIMKLVQDNVKRSTRRPQEVEAASLQASTASRPASHFEVHSRSAGKHAAQAATAADCDRRLQRLQHLAVDAAASLEASAPVEASTAAATTAVRTNAAASHRAPARRCTRKPTASRVRRQPHSRKVKHQRRDACADHRLSSTIVLWTCIVLNTYPGLRCSPKLQWSGGPALPVLVHAWLRQEKGGPPTRTVAGCCNNIPLHVGSERVDRRTCMHMYTYVHMNMHRYMHMYVCKSAYMSAYISVYTCPSPRAKRRKRSWHSIPTLMSPYRPTWHTANWLAQHLRMPWMVSGPAGDHD